MGSLVFLIVVLAGLTLGAMHGCPAMQAQEKPASTKEWEFKAVLFGTDEKNATKKLNDLATEEWQYVGPLGNGLVAFRRRYVPREQMSVEVSGNPQTVAPGEKTTITITVRAGDRTA